MLVPIALGFADGHVGARIAGHHISYAVGSPLVEPSMLLYVIATCAPGFFSRSRLLQLFAALNLLVVTLLVYLDRTAVVSLWCVWAAATSVLINAWIRDQNSPSRQRSATIRSTSSS